MANKLFKIRNHRWAIPSALLLVVLAAGCGVNNPVTPPIATGIMQATASMEGDFLAQDALADSSNGEYNVLANMTISSGQGGNLAINIIIPKSTSVPYTVDVATDPTAQLTYTIALNGASTTTYLGKESFGSGTVQITQISPTLIGTFSGTLWQYPSSGTDTVRVITDGQFNAPFQ